MFRVTVQPDEKNGLRSTSQVMVDKAVTIKRDNLGDVFGSASDELMISVSQSLAVFFGIVR